MASRLTSASPARHFDSSAGMGSDAKGRAAFHLLKKLLSEVASSPALVLGLADEIPPMGAERKPSGLGSPSA